MHKFDRKILDREILYIIKEEVGSYIIRSLHAKKHKCLYCGAWFIVRRKDNFFCNRSHYQKYHRIPGFIRKLISHKN